MLLKDKIRVCEDNGISVSKLAKEASIPVSTLTRYMREQDVFLKEEYVDKVVSAMRDIADTLNSVAYLDDTSELDIDDL